jgi:hypothetical protein
MSELVPLSALDHLLGACPFSNQLVFEWPVQLDHQRLIEAFHLTARRFQGASATLTRLDDHTLAFDMSREVAEIRVTHDGPDIPLNACFDPVDLTMGQPMTRARIVDRGARGTAIGFSMSHAVADGYGFFLFLIAWAAHARGIDFPLPNCDRTLLSNPSARNPSRQSPDVGPLEQSGFVLVDGSEPLLSLQMKDWYIAEKAVRQMADSASDKYSTHELLSALLWKECLQNAPYPTATLACPVDVRRFRDALGPLYFGNAFLQAAVTVPTEKLRAASVPEIAGWIEAAVAAVPTRIDAAIAEVEALWSTRGLDVLPRVYGNPPASGILISNLSRISLEMLDFGAGPARGFELPSAPSVSQICYVLPTPAADLRVYSATVQPLGAPFRETPA